MEHPPTRSFPWSHVVWSALALFSIPILLPLLVSVGNGVIVGFQTHGDYAAIDQAVAALGATVWFQAFPFVLLALVAIWRGSIHQDIPRSTALGAIVLAAGLAALLLPGLHMIQGREVLAVLPRAALWFTVAAVAGGLTVVVRGQRVPATA